MKFRAILGIGLLVALSMSPSFAGGTGTPLDLEGPITAIVPDGADVVVTVMGIDVIVKPDGSPINSSSAAISVAQLLDPTPFPGRGSLAGFVGGTAIVSATRQASGDVVSCNFFAEPAETVLLGTVTANPGTGTFIEVEGVECELLTDARMPGETVNGAGLPIDLATVAAGTLATVEGYFAGGKLYAFLIEADGTVVRSDVQVSIIRTRCREDKGRLRVLGGASVDSGTVDLFDADTDDKIGDTSILPDAGVAGSGTWSFRIEGLASCPANLRAEIRGTGASVEVAVSG